MEPIKPTAGDISNTLWKCADITRGLSNSMEQSYLLAYVAYLIETAGDDLTPMEAVSKIDEETVRETLTSLVADREASDAVVTMSRTLDQAELKAMILSNSASVSFLEGESATPSAICKLSLRILDINHGESVADLCCGRGNFLVDAMEETDAESLYGVELNPRSATLAMIRTSFLGENCTIELGDAFAQFQARKFDKAFSDYPLGMRTAQLRGPGEYAEKIRKGIFEYGRPSSADWAFNRLLVDSIKQDGKAVGIMTNGSAFNGMDAKVRKYFVDNGMVEAVIALPAGLYAPYTSIAVSLIVLSHGNKTVKLVDAMDLCIKGRRQNVMSDDQIGTVVDRLGTEGEHSITVNADELADRDFDLFPPRYLAREITIENPTPFGSVIAEVTRGASLRAAKLDDLVTKEETGIKYLMLSDIEDGRIGKELRNLKNLDPKLEKYCLHNGDLLLSKNGKPFKVAVVEITEDVKLLANGNLYIVRVDANKVDPHYVAAYLRSNTGCEYMARASVGTTIPNIPLRNLKEIPIPLIGMDRQRDVAAKFQAKLDEIELLKMHIEEAREEAASLFDEEA